MNELLLADGAASKSSSGKGSDDDGVAILEGSQSNFFAVVGGAVHTAPDGAVLAGTVRKLLLEVCAREGVSVVLQPPRLSSSSSTAAAASAVAGGDSMAISAWQGAMVSSTSRLLLPVDEIYRPAEGKPSGPEDLLRRFQYGGDSVGDSVGGGGGGGGGCLVTRLVRLVEAEVEAHSEAIPGLSA
jgi:hypothetical protein